MRPLYLALIALAGCAVEPGSNGGDLDAGATPTADADPNAPDADPSAPDAEPGCAALPSPSPSWLTGYQRGVVAALSGKESIAPGVILSDRASASARTSARLYLVDQLSALGYDAKLHDYGGGANVYAQLDATAPSSTYLVVGAHFDSVPGSPGANDNATGVSMVLSSARYLAGVSCRQHNVVFVLFDEEEVGLVGSFYFAEKLANDGLDVVAVHTIDQMGWDANDDRLIEVERPDPGLLAQYQAAAQAASLSIPLMQTTTGSTDHVRFREFGFAAIGLTEGYVSGDTTPEYHRPGDVFDTVDLAYLASSSALLHTTLARAARDASLAAARVSPASPPMFRPIASRCGHAADHVSARAGAHR